MDYLEDEKNYDKETVEQNIALAKFLCKKGFVKQYAKLMEIFVCDYIKPDCMITIQLHWAQKTRSIKEFETHIWFYMKSLEKALLGRRWNKHPYPFMLFYENGKDRAEYGGHIYANPEEQQKKKNTKKPWHAHVLFNATNPLIGQKLTQEQLEEAIEQANRAYRSYFHRIKSPNIHITMLETPESVQRTASYCTKELWCQFFHPDNPIRSKFSGQLFKLLKGNLDTRIEDFSQSINRAFRDFELD